jgi:hypothetical protein
MPNMLVVLVILAILPSKMSQKSAQINSHAAGIKCPLMDAIIERSPKVIFPQVNMEGII